MVEAFLSSVEFPGAEPAGDMAEVGAEGEAAAAADPLADPNVFTVDPDLLTTAGGAPPDPNAPDPAVMGRFDYWEFESVEELFEYTQREGYGWDPEIPAVCFGFQVHENEDQRRYEIEWLYRDQWPMMYATLLRTDLDPAPVDNWQLMLGYSRSAYNGINMMQVFAANSILQRRLSPDAEIVLFTVPYKIPLLTTSPYNTMIRLVNGLYFALTALTLVFYMTFALAREKEAGLRKLLIDNGLNPFVSLAAWFIQYTLSNVVITLTYVVAMKAVAF